MAPTLALDVLPGEVAVARLDPASAVPSWAHDRTFCALVLTADELTVVCPAAAVPDGVRSEGPFRVLAVRGPLDFALTGILASLTQPLAEAGISIFALSTFDTDVLLVRTADLPAATAALTAAGHLVGA
jgi:hypothetical protein